MSNLATKIERFGSLWQQIERANFSSRVRSEMSQAIALDRQIARNSQYRATLQRRLVEAYLSEASRTRDPVRRCSRVRDALRVDSDNRRARSMSASCISQAQRLMTTARRQPPSQAIRTYQRVLQLVPPESPVAASARGRLVELRRRHVRDEDE